jgi:xanthine dehydrogenase YagR molybdenum-binding subunit
MAGSIGQPMERVDGRLKVTGKATYAAEHKIDHLAYAVMVTSTIAKGRITAIDTSAAKHIPGVLAVLTHEDHLKLAKSPKEIQPGSPADRVLQLLQDDQVYYGNQPIAVAVAETLEAAQEAAGLVKVRYSAAAPAVTLNRDLSQAYAPAKMSGAGDPSHSSRGDIEAGLAAADARVEQT